LVTGTHKLPIFIPEAFTPVCASELGAISKWHGELQTLGCELIAACVDSPSRLLDWFDSEPQLQERQYKTFHSYQLTLKLNLLENGWSKRISVLIAKNGRSSSKSIR
jgi:alkyl hydroperoxide reductase subunit AhpC